MTNDSAQNNPHSFESDYLYSTNLQVKSYEIHVFTNLLERPSEAVAVFKSFSGAIK